MGHLSRKEGLCPRDIGGGGMGGRERVGGGDGNGAGWGVGGGGASAVLCSLGGRGVGIHQCFNLCLLPSAVVGIGPKLQYTSPPL